MWPITERLYVRASKLVPFSKFADKFQLFNGSLRWERVGILQDKALFVVTDGFDCLYEISFQFFHCAVEQKHGINAADNKELISPGIKAILRSHIARFGRRDGFHAVYVFVFDEMPKAMEAATGMMDEFFAIFMHDIGIIVHLGQNIVLI